LLHLASLNSCSNAQITLILTDLQKPANVFVGPRNKQLPPTPTWTCPHSQHVHTPATLRRLSSDSFHSGLQAAVFRLCPKTLDTESFVETLGAGFLKNDRRWERDKHTPRSCHWGNQARKGSSADSCACRRRGFALGEFSFLRTSLILSLPG
jgi:hypothetical protein